MYTFCFGFVEEELPFLSGFCSCLGPHWGDSFILAVPMTPVQEMGVAGVTITGRTSRPEVPALLHY